MAKTHKDSGLGVWKPEIISFQDNSRKGWGVLNLQGRAAAPGTDKTISPEQLLHVLPAAAIAASIVSTDAADTAAGTGARSIRITGLTVAAGIYTLESEDLDLDGLTPVASVKEFFRICAASVLTVGSGGAPAGDISISLNGNVQAQISAGDQQNFGAFYSTGTGAQIYIDSVALEGLTLAGIDIDFQARVYTDPNAPWRSIQRVTASTEQGYFLRVAPESDFRAVLKAGTAGQLYLNINALVVDYVTPNLIAPTAGFGVDGFGLGPFGL